MPNRCENSLVIVTRVDPKEFLTLVNNEYYVVHFEKLLPIDDYGIMQAQNRRGTKRDVYHKDGANEVADAQVEITEADGVYTIAVSFDTARSPPIGYYKKLYKVLKRRDSESHVEAYYIEDGVGFLGSWIDGVNNEMNMIGIYNFDSFAIIESSAKKKVRDKMRGCAYSLDEIPLALKEESFDEEEKELINKLLDSYNKKDD